MSRFVVLLSTVFFLIPASKADIVSFDYSIELDSGLGFSFASAGTPVSTAAESSVSSASNQFFFGGASVGFLRIDPLAGNFLDVELDFDDGVPPPLGGAPIDFLINGFNAGADTISSWAFRGDLSTGGALVSPVLTASALNFSLPTGDVGAAGTDFNWRFEYSTAGAAVPEPSSVAMLCALGLGGFWIRRRRQAAA